MVNSPFSSATFAEIDWKISLTAGHASSEPHGIIEGPFNAPSSPPETPEPTNKMPFSANARTRRFVSG